MHKLTLDPIMKRYLPKGQLKGQRKFVKDAD